MEKQVKFDFSKLRKFRPKWLSKPDHKIRDHSPKPEDVGEHTFENKWMMFWRSADDYLTKKAGEILNHAIPTWVKILLPVLVALAVFLAIIR